MQQARLEAARSQRQYDTVDPENRLVAAELEQRWKERLRREEKSVMIRRTAETFIRLEHGP